MSDEWTRHHDPHTTTGLRVEETPAPCPRGGRIRPQESAFARVPSGENTVVIIDTDIGGDPDDAIALAVAARCAPALELVTTSDETGPGPRRPGLRARFARILLDRLGRPDVPVAAGAGGETRYVCVEDLVPASAPPQGGDVIAAVRAVAATRPGPIDWVGLGPLTNLALLLAEAPELAPRLRVTQMGGALRYRSPERAEHNFRLDVPAVHAVFAAVADGRLAPPRFVTSEITFVPDTEIGPGHTLHRALSAPAAPAWASLLAAHLDEWFARFFPGTRQHDALALSAALDLPFVAFAPTPLAVDPIGRTTAADGAPAVRVSASAEYGAFMSWLEGVLLPGRSCSAGA
ncbi:nucleoside hydrolase [Nocardiopsis potens]|uniref:nucleoside hydrolase n=1 Tax=Nocardiopsis potens TaxID=1246458 RepID=UPI000374F6B5|nr:nucleoside hydrolase [Nocardiopsis potens]